MTPVLEGLAPEQLIGPSSVAQRGEQRPGPENGARSVQEIALAELRDTGPATGPLLSDWSPLHQVKATLKVLVGEATLTVGELLSAKASQVLRLDRAIDDPVDLTIEGKIVARGQLVAVDDHFAVRITELPVPLTLDPGS